MDTVILEECILLQAGVPEVCDAVERKILDLYLTKHWALKFATTAACTVLRVDQVSLSLCTSSHLA